MRLKQINLFFIITLLFILDFSCRESSNIKYVNNNKENNQTSITNSNLFKFSDSLTFKAQYDSSNKILIPKLNRFLRDSNYSNYADAANRIAANYRKLGNYDSAFAFCTKALNISESKLDSVNLSTAQTFYLLGLMYKDFRKRKETLEYLNKSLSIRKKLLSENDPLIGDVYNNLGVVFYIGNNYPKAREYFRVALKLRKTRGFFDKSVGSTYMNLGNLYEKMGEYKNSISFFDTAMTIEKKLLGNNHPLVGVIFLNMADSYDQLGFLDSAIAYDKKALKIFKNTFGKYHLYIANVYNNLGLYYKSFGDYQNSINFYLKSIEVKKKLNADFNIELFDNYSNLGESYRILGNLKESINYFKKAIKIIKNQNEINIKYLSSAKRSIAFTYLLAGNNVLALKSVEEAIQIQKNVNKIDSLSLYRSKAFLSKVLNKVGYYDKAIENSKGCIVFFKNGNNISWLVFSNELLAESYLLKQDYEKLLSIYANLKTYFGNSDGSLSISKINSYSNVNDIVSETLNYVGKSYLELFNKTAKAVYLKKAEKIYKLIMKLFVSNYGNITTETSKIEYTKKIKIFIQTGLDAAYKNFALVPSNTNFEYALNLAEFGKSLTVLESLSKNSALKLSNIPDDLTKRITTLRKKIQYFLKQLSRESDESISDIKRKNLRDRLFETRLEFGELKDSLENVYPIYKSLSQISLNNSLANIKASILDNNQSAVEYYLEKNELYVFIITGDKLSIIKKKLDDNFESRINNLLDGIKNNQSDIYKTNAYYIYNTIFAEADNLITTKRVLIINDGVLGYIPYDALLYAKPKKNSGYKNLPYLINKYSIGYAYSFNILGKSEQGDKIISKFLGIAPFSK